MNMVQERVKASLRQPLVALKLTSSGGKQTQKMFSAMAAPRAHSTEDLVEDCRGLFVELERFWVTATANFLHSVRMVRNQNRVNHGSWDKTLFRSALSLAGPAFFEREVAAAPQLEPTNAERQIQVRRPAT